MKNEIVEKLQRHGKMLVGYCQVFKTIKPVCRIYITLDKIYKGSTLMFKRKRLVLITSVLSC